MIYIDLLEDQDDDAVVVEAKLRKLPYPYTLTRFCDVASATASYQSLLNQKNETEALSSNRLVFLDLTLKDSHGFDFLKFVQVEPRLKNIVSLVITASNSKMDIRDSFRHGGCHVLGKPFNFDDFSIILNTLIITNRLHPKLP